MTIIDDLPTRGLILFMVRLWLYRCYVDHRGKSIVADWVKSKSKKAQMNLRRTLEHLSQKPRETWERPQSSSLGNHIYVIRFKDENGTQWRIYGEHDLQHKCFVLCCTGTERGNIYDPPSETCCATTVSRMAECRESWDTRTCSCLSESSGSQPIPGNVFPTKLVGR
jgi:hypothetical protein